MIGEKSWVIEMNRSILVVLAVVVLVGLIALYKWGSVPSAPAQSVYDACLQRAQGQVAKNGLGQLEHLRTPNNTDREVMEMVCASFPAQAFTPGFDFSKSLARRGQPVAYTPPDHRSEAEKISDCRDRGHAAVKNSGKDPRAEDSVAMVNAVCDKSTNNFK